MEGKRATLRIRGLVSLMNDVRDQLRNGIPEEDAAAFRETVRNAVRTVENICRAHGTTPMALPRPSKRAYTYLKSLDLSALPKPQTKPILPRGSIRVAGIIATCDRYHRRLSSFVFKQPGPYAPDDPTVQDLACALQTEVQAIAGLCEDAGGVPAALPVRSERGYQWLSYLSDPTHLTRHLETLSLLYQAGRRHGFSGTKLEVQIYATSALYRTKARSASRQVLINEGFIMAPSPVLENLMALALNVDGDPAKQEAVRGHSLTDAFTGVQAALQAETQPLAGSARGQHHDLDAAFDRVNMAYFGGKVDRPRLVWSRRPTRRKLGHYDQLQDTVLVSMSLDARDVPAYVIEFVVYHEILHRELGTQVVNGRRNAHTPTFRKRERAFKDYDRAQAFLGARHRESA